jgi:multicomponent Na+:H+ antiporter subunit D
MKAAMVLLAAGCIGLGLFPGLLYAGLPFPVDYVPYNGEHLVTQLQLLLFAGLAFFVMLPMMKRTSTLTLDWDWLYRRLGSYLVAQIATRGKEGWEEFTQEPETRIRRLWAGLSRTHGPQGSLARSWPSGSMVLWVGVILGAYLIFALL